MKKFTLSLLIFFSLSYPIFAQELSTDKHTLGLWHFDEGSGATTSDASSNRNDGKITDAAWIEGFTGKALDFTGSNDYVQVNDSPSLSAIGKNLTIEFYIWLDSYPATNYKPILGKWGTGGSSDDEFNINIWSDGKIGTSLSGTSGSISLEKNDTPLPTGQWVYVAIVLDGSTHELRYYLNKKLDGTISTNIVLDRDTSQPLYFGKVQGNIDFNGKLDEVRISNIARQYDELEISDTKIIWTEGTPFAIEHGEINAELIGRNIYIPGGGYYSGGYGNTALSIYNIDNDSWSNGAPMLTAKAGNMCTSVLFDKLFCAGGEGPSAGRWSPEFEQYDPVTNQWEYKTNWSPPKRDAGLVALDGKLYAIGGHKDYNAMLSDVDVYDYLTDSWSKVSNYPITIDQVGAVAFDNKIYAFGGKTGPSQSNRTIVDNAYVYDPSIDEWAAIANLPSPRSYVSLGVYNDKIYILCGYRKENDENVYLNGEVLEYSPFEDKYRIVECEGFSSATIWAYGDNAPVIDNEIFLISSSAYDPETEAWFFSPKVQRGQFIGHNTPPVAKAKDLTIQTENCSVSVQPIELDDGSYDPDGDDITFKLEPAGPYYLGVTNIKFIVFDNDSLSDTTDVSISVEGGIADITGTISANQNELQSVIVKLLDNTDPTLIIADTLTDGNGQYFFSTTPDTYQVMVVVPIGYSTNQNFIITSVACGDINVVDFILNKEIVLNDARGKGYWKHQFDVYVNGNGKAEESEEDLQNYIDEVHSRYTPHFPIFADLDTFEEWQEVLSVKGNAGMEEKAKSQLAALVLNIMSEKLAQYEIVTEDDYTAGDVMTYVSELLPEEDSDPGNDEQAKDLAEQVNEQQIITAGKVHPSRNILYKGGDGNSQDNPTSMIPDNYAIYQNYPNPFNPKTYITYDLPEPGNVKLTVFDVRGRVIKTLVNGYKNAGQHKMVFDGSDISSGIYFYKIRVNDFLKVKKLIITK